MDELGFEELYENFDEEAREAAHDSVYEILSERAKQLETTLRNTTPVRTGKLKGSIVNVVVENSETKVVIRVKFDGYNRYGKAYQVIANSLNKGFFRPDGSFDNRHAHFIDIAVSKCLTGMDAEIASLFEVKLGGAIHG